MNIHCDKIDCEECKKTGAAVLRAVSARAYLATVLQHLPWEEPRTIRQLDAEKLRCLVECGHLLKYPPME